MSWTSLHVCCSKAQKPFRQAVQSIRTSNSWNSSNHHRPYKLKIKYGVVQQFKDISYHANFQTWQFSTHSYTNLCENKNGHFTVTLDACKLLWLWDTRASQQCYSRLNVNRWTVPEVLQDHRKWSYYVSSKHLTTHPMIQHHITQIFYNNYVSN
jgi:hypothetical protein